MSQIHPLLHVFQNEKNRFFTKQNTSFLSSLLQVVGGSGLIALCSQIKILLPFTIVPLTLQTLAILLIGASLGSKKGACAVLLYFGEIFIGLPVLAGGISNPLIFLGPKGGYVLGFLVQAYLMGWVLEKTTFSRPLALIVGGVIACTAQMSLGVLVLAQYVGWNHVWMMGLFPFIPGEIIKICALIPISSRKEP